MRTSDYVTVMSVRAGLAAPVPPPMLLPSLRLWLPKAGPMWQNAAGTIPASVADPVGRRDDVSGFGHHASQSTGANRPTRTAEGTDHDGAAGFLIVAGHADVRVGNVAWTCAAWIRTDASNLLPLSWQFNAADAAYTYRYSANGKQQCDVFAAGDRKANAEANAAALGTPSFVQFGFDPAVGTFGSAWVRLDGGARAYGAASAAPAADNGDMVVGARTSAGGGKFDGAIGAVYFGHATWTDAELDAVMPYEPMLA